MDITTRLKLPLLAAGQAQKEAWHNEALLLVDRLLAGVIEGAASATPPGSPTADGLYAVAAAATGAWAGQDGMLAAYSSSGWRFVAPAEGMRLVERASGQEWRRLAGSWEIGRVQAHELYIDGVKVVGARSGTIAAPTGGATVDTESRVCLAAILAALRTHGLIT